MIALAGTSVANPIEIDDADACRGLFEASLLIWQKMSVNTMRAFNRISVDPVARGDAFA